VEVRDVTARRAHRLAWATRPELTVEERHRDGHARPSSTQNAPGPPDDGCCIDPPGLSA
jgi:hypothetical protein